MKFLASLMIVLLCVAVVPQAQAQVRKAGESTGSYNLPAKEKSSASRTKSLYTSKKSTSTRSGTKGAAYTSKATGSSSGSQPLSVNSILNGTYKPKRVIAGYNDRTDASVPYSSLKTRGGSAYAGGSLAAMRQQSIDQLEETRRNAQLSYEQQVAERLARLQERRESDRLRAQALAAGQSPAVRNVSQAFGSQRTSTTSATKRRQVYVKDNGVDEPTRLFDSAR